MKALDLRRGLFGNKTNIAITAGYAAFVWLLVVPFVQWAFVNATLHGTSETCRLDGGACWAFIVAKANFITFGFYPADLQWRATVASMLLLAVVVAICVPRLWSRWLAAIGLFGLVVAVLFLLGFPFGPIVGTEQWGGLPITLLLSIVALAGAFPLAVVLALARQSRRGGIRILAVGFIEIVRGVPFISILYMATLLFPLMLPHGASIDKFLRAQVALILFVSAYMAEIVRAGLSSVPRGQSEAGSALGLSYFSTMRLIVMPQALRAVIPSLVNLAIGVFQDTTLVLVIGMFDFLNTARAAATDPQWLGYYDESFAFVAVVYFVCCFALSRYSLWLERYLGRSRAR